MGATDFQTTVKARTAQAAFKKAQEQARYDHGHAGYTGTIAEKPSFVEVDLPIRPDGTTMGGRDFIEILGSVIYAREGDDLAKLFGKTGGSSLEFSIRKAQKIWEEKWGPALAIKTGKGEWTFLGLASC